MAFSKDEDFVIIILSMRIISWNVNGVRAACKKGLMDFISISDADIFFIQETKAHLNQLEREVYAPTGYKSWWYSAEKRGYSGTAFWTKKQPDAINPLGVEEFDSEGRAQVVFFGNLALLNCYFPNSQPQGARLEYKLSFNRAVKKYGDNLVNAGKTVIIAGDYNVAHKPIDLARPKENEKTPGYLPEERAWMDTFISGGWTDTFREFEAGPNHYTWWSYRTNARAHNIGWRIDYFCVDDASAGRVESSVIMPNIGGSDHCPIALELN